MMYLSKPDDVGYALYDLISDTSSGGGTAVGKEIEMDSKVNANREKAAVLVDSGCCPCTLITRKRLIWTEWT